MAQSPCMSFLLAPECWLFQCCFYLATLALMKCWECLFLKTKCLYSDRSHNKSGNTLYCIYRYMGIIKCTTSVNHTHITIVILQRDKMFGCFGITDFLLKMLSMLSYCTLLSALCVKEVGHRFLYKSFGDKFTCQHCFLRVNIL